VAERFTPAAAAAIWEREIRGLALTEHKFGLTL
jgi:hypothetical protein